MLIAKWPEKFQICLHMCSLTSVSLLFTNTNYSKTLSGHPKVDKTKILMTNGSLMKVESIA